MKPITEASTVARHVLDAVAEQLDIPPAKVGETWLYWGEWTLQASPVKIGADYHDHYGLMWCLWRKGELQPARSEAASLTNAALAVADLVAWAMEVAK